MDLGDRPSRGCGFAPRCPFALDACWSLVPPLVPIAGSHSVACHNPAAPTARDEPAGAPR